MKNKLMIILLGGATGFLSVGVAQADSAYERALGVGINQGYQGASRAGTEVYPGVWSKGRSQKKINREEIYPGVWSESSVATQGTQPTLESNQSGYSIVKRSTSNNKTSGGFKQRSNNQNIDTEIRAREEASQEEYRRNSRPNSSSSGSFSGRSSVNTPAQTVPGMTVRDREHTNVSVDSLINPEFD
jgi:hypothetical protein